MIKMSHLLDKSCGIGLHRYNPAGFPGAIFLDVADAQYNPLNPEEIIAGIHPACRLGTYGLAKFKGGAVLAEVTTPYKWDSGLEPYTDVAEGLVYAAPGTSVVEVRDLEDLHLQRELNLPVKGITSTALEALVPHHHIIAPKPALAWDQVEKLGGKCKVRVPGV